MGKRISLSALFLEFLKLGATGFGGPAMIDYIRQEICAKRNWLDRQDFDYGIAVSQIIPGATATQVATYAGLRIRGVTGGLLGFLGFILPSLVLMLGLSYLYVRFQSQPKVVVIFSGLQAVIISVIASAALNFSRSYLRGTRELGIGLIALIWLLLQVPPVLTILFSVLLGLALYPNKPIVSQESKAVGAEYSQRVILILLLALGLGLILLLVWDRERLELAFLMLRAGSLAFGGGYSAIAIMSHDLIHSYHWLSASALIDGIALGQITPGPVVITAVFIGYLHSGLLGALVATVSVFSPSLLILIAVVPYFDRMRKHRYFNRAVGGILCGFVALLFWLAVSLGIKIHWDLFRVILASAAFLALRLKVEMIWVIIAGAIIVAVKSLL